MFEKLGIFISFLSFFPLTPVKLRYSAEYSTPKLLVSSSPRLVSVVCVWVGVVYAGCGVFILSLSYMKAKYSFSNG